MRLRRAADNFASREVDAEEAMLSEAGQTPAHAREPAEPVRSTSFPGGVAPDHAAKDHVKRRLGLEERFRHFRTLEGRVLKLLETLRSVSDTLMRSEDVVQTFGETSHF